MKAGTRRGTTMKVEAERTTTRGDHKSETYSGERFVNPPGVRPKVDNQKVLGGVTATKELDGGDVTFIDPDNEFREFSSVLDVTVGPMGEKARVTFIAASSEMVPLGNVLYAETADR